MVPLIIVQPIRLANANGIRDLLYYVQNHRPSLWRSKLCRSISLVGRILLWCLIAFTSGARPAAADGWQGSFMVATSEGAVLATVEGATTGFTNAALTRLIREGAAESYPTYCATPSDITAARRRILWHVIKDGRKPVALISVELIQDGNVGRKAYRHVADPGANPPVVFAHEAARLVLHVLSPATSAQNR